MRRVLIFTAASSLAACSLLTSLDDLGTGSDGSVDAEAGSDVVVVDAPADAGSDVSEAGFSPLAITGLELWVAADVGTQSFDGGATWKDQSPKAHSVIADGGVCHPPTLLASAINKLPAFSFNPYQPDCFNISQGFDDFTGGLVMMVVAQPQTCSSSFIGSSAAFLDLSSATGVNDITLGRNSEPANTSSGDFQLSVENGDAGYTTSVSADSGTSWINGITHLYEVVIPSGPEGATTSGFLYLDGTQLSTPTLTIAAPRVATRTDNYIGKAASTQTGYVDLCAFIGEIIVYSSIMSDKDRKSLEAYLKGKWGL